MKLYKLVKVTNITKLCLFDLRIAAWFFELKRHHLTHQVGRVSDGLNLLPLVFLTLRGQSPLIKPPAGRQFRTILL